jgi:type II secretory pathway pseudopilin PulG
VIVVAIIAILAAIGIPRMSRGAKGASDAALTGDLATIRNAIDLYATEHNGAYPAETGTDNINTQLTQYTDGQGAVSPTRTTSCIYGPYLRSIPPLPVGTKKGSAKIGPGDANDVGWIYDDAEGTIYANTSASEKDDTNKLYSEY